MKDEDIQNLLGGFATDTLTDRERELLFTAALKNQELFDALANDQALRELLSDPVSRRQLLQALEPEQRGMFAWLRRPLVWGVAVSAMTALVVAVALRQARPPVSQIAQTETMSRPEPTPQPVPAPKASRPRREDRSREPRPLNAPAAPAQPRALMKDELAAARPVAERMK